MNVNSLIYDAFAARVTLFATAQSLPCAYPGIPFVPPNSGKWLELAWFPNTTENVGIGNDGPSLHQGFGQIAVCDRPGGGIAGVTTIADLAIAYFAKGSVFGPATVERKPWQSSVLVADDRITAPVTVRYKALIAD